jgi:hypothetical protein
MLDLENRRYKMLSMFRKTMIGSIASLAIGFAAVGVSAPASAATWHGGGGGGGFHGGGGWHGGGGGWHHRGGGFGGYGLGLGLGGLGYGADYYGDDYGYDSGCLTYRPVYDRYGRYLGRQPVNVC